MEDKNERLTDENARLREKNKAYQAVIKNQEEMIAALNLQVQTLNGYKFEKQKQKFVSSRI